MKTFSIADLPTSIPLFPLPGALLLPRARLPLNIFEPRYLAMLDTTFATEHRLIGMVQPQPVPGSGKSSDQLHAIGCAGRVIAFNETDDGRYMITLNGVSRFRITQELDGFTPFRRANVEWGPFQRDLGGDETDPGFKRKPFLDTLARYFETVNLSSDWDSLKKAEPELLINSLSMLCPLDVEEKQALLEAPDLTNRRETLVTLMEFALASGGEEGKLQ